MKISEMVLLLENFQEQFGDLDIFKAKNEHTARDRRFKSLLPVDEVMIELIYLKHPLSDCESRQTEFKEYQPYLDSKATKGVLALKLNLYHHKTKENGKEENKEQGS